MLKQRVGRSTVVSGFSPLPRISAWRLSHPAVPLALEGQEFFDLFVPKDTRSSRLDAGTRNLRPWSSTGCYPVPLGLLLSWLLSSGGCGVAQCFSVRRTARLEPTTCGNRLGAPWASPLAPRSVAVIDAHSYGPCRIDVGTGKRVRGGPSPRKLLGRLERGAVARVVEGQRAETDAVEAGAK